jgi:hypothetical protein
MRNSLLKQELVFGIIMIFAGTSVVSSSAVFGSIISETSDEVITLNYYFTAPKINRININGNLYDEIILDDVPSFGNPGEPCLPIKGAHILLPPGSQVKNIIVETSEKIFFGDGFTVLPSGEPVPLSEISYHSYPEPDQTIYDSDEMFPGRMFDEIGVYSYRGFDILVLDLYPVQYIPSSGELFYYPSLKICVETCYDGHQNIFYRGLISDGQEILKKVDNPVDVDRYSFNKPASVNLEEYDLLILTTDTLKNAFQDLKTFHDNCGVKTIIKTLDDVGGNKTPEDIRDFVRDAYTNWGINYLLIGGDADVVPAKMLYVNGYDEDQWFNQGFMPVDMYYGCLDGPFNYDGDSKWGEPTDGESGGDVDLIAEVFIGRACVDSKEDVNNFVSKTIAYMDWDLHDEYIDKVLMAGEHLGDYGISSWGGNLLDLLIDGSTIDGYETVGIPTDKFTVEKLYDRDWENNYWPVEEIIQRINNDVHILNHDGHSYYGYNMKMNNEDVTLLTNDKYFFVYSVGCMAGGFDDPEGYDCFAEYITVKSPHGAFAAIMNARYGYFWSFKTDGDSTRFTREFWDAVFGEGIPIISKANQDSKEDNLHLITRSMIRWTYYELNLFGDPVVTLHISNPPEKPLTPEGLTSGKPGEEYTYETSTTDPDTDQVYYLFNWDDDTNSGWLGPYNSGDKCQASHTWQAKGSYSVTVKAKDIFGAESPWSDPLPIKMPYSYNKPIPQFLELLFHRFPNTFPLLQHLLG